ncbi:hypothetical protein NE237_016893 [Protea cynaroides]|uniref:Uncharacterized protein n=1 Tax=Protea cynaroides TaxID=273540 RepID=A0A9Q0K5X5_9MAGN|nr:hypothetical protein NE237_016893 [Protea cynaroides]
MDLRMLVAYEIRIEQHHLSSPPEANIVSSYNGCYGRSNQQSTNPTSSDTKCGRGLGRDHHQSSNGSNTFHSYYKVQCQVCGRTRHTAIACYHRFDQSYTQASQQSTAYAANTSNSPPLLPSPDIWYPNFGATDHITADVSHMTLNFDYQDSDQVTDVTPQF